jgi:hypothetical protein
MLQQGMITMSWNWMDGCKPTKHTGIFKTQAGYRVRVRAMDPRTGTLKGVNREFEGITLEEAVVKQAEMRGEIRCGGRSGQRERDRYGDYAESLFERKQSTGELKSAKSRERWADTQDGHLIPAFGDWYIDQIRRNDIEEWKASQAKRVQRGKLSPHTVNGWLRILLTTLRRALVDLDLEYDPTKGIKPLDTSTWHTYTEEQPNSLTVEEVPRFMAKARELYPQHFAMLALGLATGRRPSELRPLRRTGPTPDILWDEGVLLVRRSEARGEVMERTKTGKRLRIPLPRELMDIQVGRVPRSLVPGQPDRRHRREGQDRKSALTAVHAADVPRSRPVGSGPRLRGAGHLWPRNHDHAGALQQRERRGGPDGAWEGRGAHPDQATHPGSHARAGRRRGGHR